MEVPAALGGAGIHVGSLAYPLANLVNRGDLLRRGVSPAVVYHGSQLPAAYLRRHGIGQGIVQVGEYVVNGVQEQQILAANGEFLFVGAV